MATLTAYDTSYSRDDYENMGTGAEYIQSFQLSAVGTATAVEINGSRGNAASGTFKVEIRTAYNSGVIATTGTLTTTSALPAFNSGGVDTFTSLSLTVGVELTAGVTYFMAVTALTGSASDEIRWNTDTTSPSYSGGSVINPSTGATDTTRDKVFRVTGTLGAANTRRQRTSMAPRRASSF